MNFSFLPEKIKKQLTEVIDGKIPVSIARSSASIEGKVGEGYIIAYDDKIFMFSRELGESKYMKISADLGNIRSVDIEKEGISTFLNIDLAGKKYSMKFSSFEEKNLKSILDVWSSRKEIPVTAGSAGSAAAEESLNITIGLAAAMMYVASVDDDISKEEDYYIIAMMGNDRAVLTAGLAYYKSHTFDELVTELNSISNEQKLCFLANMMELGMKDGVLHSSELELMRKFSDAMQITEDQYNTIKQVLLIKNKTSVLYRIAI